MRTLVGLKVDTLGRITIPIHIRNELDLNTFDEISMYIVNNQVVLSKEECYEDSRKLDANGRLVIAKTLRERANIDILDEVDLSVVDKRIFISKIHTKCIFCSNDNEEELIEYENFKLCKGCIKKISELKI